MTIKQAFVDSVAASLGNEFVRRELENYISVAARSAALSTSHDPRICKCGTCAEALEAAYRLYDQLRQNQCGFWVTQVVAALQFIQQSEDAARLGVSQGEMATKASEETDPARVMEIAALGSLSSEVDRVVRDGTMKLYIEIDSPIRPTVQKIEDAIFAERKKHDEDKPGSWV